MHRFFSGVAVLLVLFGIVVYARDCRRSFSQWKHCGGDPGQPGIAGEWASFGWNVAGLFSDVLYVDGKPVGRLLKYDFGLGGDVMEIVSLDGTKRSRYCGK